ncbi:MAG: transcriptional regulator, partial [Pseudomonadota bacterium]
MHAPETEYAFDKDLTTRLRGLRAPVKKGLAKWSALQLLGLFAIAGTLLWLLTNTQNRFFQPDTLHVTLVLGSLGIWRFGWWFT